MYFHRVHVEFLAGTLEIQTIYYSKDFMNFPPKPQPAALSFLGWTSFSAHSLLVHMNGVTISI